MLRIEAAVRLSCGWHVSLPLINACVAQGVYDDLEFDGLWIDMNEPSNYCTGDVCWNNGEADPRSGHCTQFRCLNISILCSIK